MLDQIERRGGSTALDVPGPAGAEVAPAGGAPRVTWILLAGGGVGLLSAAVLLIEKIRLLEDPDYVPTCSINPILSCGSVMQTEQAEAFGFPNPILGVVGFTVVVTVGAALLAGATVARWFWLALQAGATFGVVFVHWLIFQSLYRIDALCPYCMVVWAVTIPVFWYVTLHNQEKGHLRMPHGAGRVAGTLATYHGVVLTAWYLLIAGLVANRFWDYWSTLLT